MDTDVDSFKSLAGKASGNNHVDSLFIWNKVHLAILDIAQMQEDLGLNQIGMSLMFGLAIIGLIGFGLLVTCIIVLAYAEAYIVMSAGVVLLGFGGSQFTSQYRDKYLHTAMIIGLKLFIIILLANLGVTFIERCLIFYTSGLVSNMFTSLGLLFLFAFILKTVPASFASMVGGAGINGGGGMTASTARMAGAAAIGAATGGAAAVVTAGKLAGAQAKAGEIGGGVGSKVAATGKNLASAFRQDLNSAFGPKDQASKFQPTAGHRMSSRMSEQVEQLQDKAEANKETNTIEQSSSTDSGQQSSSTDSGQQSSSTDSGQQSSSTDSGQQSSNTDSGQQQKPLSTPPINNKGTADMTKPPVKSTNSDIKNK